MHDGTRRWHHIYLPMLPRSFMDYLSAPMPFMASGHCCAAPLQAQQKSLKTDPASACVLQVGLPAQMLDMLRGIPMDDVIRIDLDINECDPKPGSPRDDAKLLPGKERLQVGPSAVFVPV